MADQPPGRRRLLANTDTLLDRVEQLRLADQQLVPDDLGSAILQAARSTGAPLAGPPATLAAAHRYLLRLQGLLMSGRLRAGGDAPTSATGRTDDLPHIALPVPERAASWQVEVQQVVQRAYDTATYLWDRYLSAGSGPDQELATRRLDEAFRAQEGYQQVRDEAEQRTGRRMRLEPLPTLPTGGKAYLGDLTIDLDQQVVLRGDVQVGVTATERVYLLAFAVQPDRVWSREALMHVVHGNDPYVELRSRAVDVHLSNLRRKIGQPILASVPGVGWRVAENFRALGPPQRQMAAAFEQLSRALDAFPADHVDRLSGEQARVLEASMDAILSRLQARRGDSPGGGTVVERQRARRETWARGSRASPPASPTSASPRPDARPARP